MRNLLIALLLPVLAYLALCALMYFGQRSQIYFPVGESSPQGATVMHLVVDEGVEEIERSIGYRPQLRRRASRSSRRPERF